MKKTFKRLGAVLLAMAMAVSVLCTGAMAEGDDDSTTTTTTTTTTYTLTINDTNKNHKYVAYQVFTGTLSTQKVLSDIQWGEGVDTAAKKDTDGTADDTNGKTLVEAIQAITVNEQSPFAGKTTAAEIAEVLGSTANNTQDSAVAKAFAAVVANYVTGNGYASGTWTDATGDGESKVAAHYTISSLTAGYYFVKSNNDTGATDVANTRYILSVVGDSTVDTKSAVPTVDKKVNDKDADTANIGDKVTFTLTGTLPDNLDSYDSYKYIFHDTLTSNLELDKNSIKVYKDSIADNNLISNTESKTYYTTKLADSTTLTDGCTFEVEFSNVKDISGITKDSKIIVVYEATLNNTANIGANTTDKEGNITEANSNTVKLEYSNDPNKDGTGTTTEKEVFVYTFQIDVDKYDTDNKSKKLSGAEFILTREVQTGEADKTKTQYAVVENGKLKEWSDSKESATTLTTDDQGKISVAGLDAGTYYLEETKAPDGYNLLTNKVTVTITATMGTGTEANVLKTLASTVNGEANTNTNLTNGTVTVEVANSAGSQLPSTGGMGTTLFYVIGGVLMAGAAIVLVIKKKRSSAE